MSSSNKEVEQNSDGVKKLDTVVHTVDQALTLAGTGRFQYIVLAVAGASSICVVIENQSMSYVMPAAKCDLEISVGEQGFINSVGFLGVLVASHFWGFLTDTWGRHRTLRLTLLCTFLSSSISSLSLVSWMLIITRFFVGVSSVGIRIAGIAYLDEFLTEANRSKYLTFYSSLASIGVIVQPMLGLAIMTMTFEYEILPLLVLKPWRLFILLGSLITGLASFALMFLPEGPKHMLSMGKKDDALAVLQMIHKVNKGVRTEDHVVNDIAPMDSKLGSNLSEVKGIRNGFRLVWSQTTELFGPPHLSSMIQLCLLMFLTLGVAQGMQLWFPQILAYYPDKTTLPLTLCQVIALGRSSELAGLNDSLPNTLNNLQHCAPVNNPLMYYIIISMGIVFVMTNVIVGFLFKKLGTTLLLSSRLLMNAVAAVALIWASQFYLNIVFMIMLLSTIALMNVIIAISGDKFSTHHKGMAISTMVMAGRMGSIAGSNLVGAMLYSHCEWLLYGNAAILLGATSFCYYILKKSDSKIDSF